MNAIIRLILRRPGWVITFGLLLTIISSYFAAQLYINLKTDLEELLPTTARSVVDLNEVTDRLSSTENLTILVFSKDTQASKKFVTDLAENLKKHPKDTFARIDYRINKEIKFFNDRKILYIEYEDLIGIRNYIQDRISYEKSLYNPLNIFSFEEIPEPSFDFEELQKKYDGKVSRYTMYPDGYYANPKETIRAIQVHMPGKLSGIHGAKLLRNTIDLEIEKLNPKSYAQDIEIKFTGGVQNLLEEHASLLADLELSTIIVLFLVTLVMLLYFKTVRGTFAIMVSLLMGTIITFGVSYFWVGYLNANTAFLGAIVIGNGINFGIIFLARYLEERTKGNGHVRATYSSMTKTFTATITAALAAGLAYGSLVLTSFRGFSQFGVIGFIGMVFCWISAYTLLPAILTVMDSRKSLITSIKPPKRIFAGFISRCIGKWAIPIWIVSFLVTLVSVASFYKLDSNIIEKNLGKLRDKKSMTEGSGYNSKYSDEVFGRYTSPIVILAKSQPEAKEISRRLKQHQKDYGKKSFFETVMHIGDFIPPEQGKKLRIISEINTILPEHYIQRLPKKEKKLVREFINKSILNPVTEEKLPELIKENFTEKDGSFGKLVLIEPPTNDDLWNGDNLNQFIYHIRRIVDSVNPNAAVSGTLPVTSDMFLSIKKDGPKATLFSFLAVVLLALFLFRNLNTVGLVLFSLIIGMLWLFGIIILFGFKINFLNFIALPITFGIGVDYGVNIFQRYRQEKKKNILAVIRHTGGAVTLASLTTIIGYGSLLIAGNQAFVSFGALAVIGEITCLIAAIIALPAYLSFKERKETFTIEKDFNVFSYYLLRIKSSLRSWPKWWEQQSVTKKILPAFIVIIYLVFIHSFFEISFIHITLSIFTLLISYGGETGRSILKFSTPFLLSHILLTAGKLLRSGEYSSVYKNKGYLFDKNFFGIKTQDGILTPNEWFNLNSNEWLNYITSYTYLFSFIVFILFCIYFYFWVGRKGTPLSTALRIRLKRPRIAWSFFIVCIIYLCAHFFFQVAPPWYMQLHGLGALESAKQSFDWRTLIDLPFALQHFQFSLKGFSSTPSLHAACTFLMVYFSIKFGTLRFFSFVFFVISSLSVVYLNQGYVLDIISGAMLSLLIALIIDCLFDIVFRKKGSINSLPMKNN